ncbi:MAG: T9SS type A sorting domain-containing protein [Aequorivita sp.]
MKNKFIVLFLLFCGFSNAQIVNIPDANFKAALLVPSAGIDTNNDGEIQVSEAEAAVKINAFGFNIVSLEGIQYFINITDLYVDDNQIEVMDLSQNTQLEIVFCDNNLLTSLDLTNSPKLNWIDCGNNPLQTLNVNGLMDLATLQAYNAELTVLDVSNNPNLGILDIENNIIEYLDISQNINLRHLYVSQNLLESLNLKNGNNTSLRSMYAQDNPDLFCIQVDDTAYANSRICETPSNGWCKDETSHYNEDCQLGIQELTAFNFKLYPNPTANVLNIDSKKDIESVKIYSTQGVLVKESASKAIDISTLQTGIYFVQVVINGSNITKRFIKE